MPVAKPKKHNEKFYAQKYHDLMWTRISFWILAVALGLFLGTLINPALAQSEIIFIETIKVEKEFYIPTKDDVLKEIYTQVEDSEVSLYDAIRISKCESNFNSLAKNQQGSSATGVFQFIDKTWENHCVGERLNYKDNIACFMALYPKYPNWWACN